MSATDQMPPPAYEEATAAAGTDADDATTAPQRAAEGSNSAQRSAENKSDAQRGTEGQNDGQQQGAAAGTQVGGFGFRVGGSFVGVGVAPEGRTADGVGISLGGVMVGVTTGTTEAKKEEQR